LKERLVFKSLLTIQPLTACHFWLEARLKNRFREIEEFSLSKSLGASLLTKLRDLSIRVERAPALVSYHEVRGIWLECLSRLELEIQGENKDPADCFEEFLILEKSFARWIWLNRPFPADGTCMQLFTEGVYKNLFEQKQGSFGCDGKEIIKILK